MQYDGTIRIQSNINTKYLKEMSKITNYFNKQSGYMELSNAVHNAFKTIKPLYTHSYMELFSNSVTLFQNSIIGNFMQSSIDIHKSLNCILFSYGTILQQCISEFPSSFVQFKVLSDKCLFLKIADEIGFPIYLEIDSELQDRLIATYMENGGRCDKKEMCEIIWEYYNDSYIDQIFNGIKNAHVFNEERVVLIEEGIETYQLGLYGSSASLFAAQLSGMIRDVYEELSIFHRISKKEKNELLISYNQNCKPDSEKGMLLQIVNCQRQGFMVWHKVLRHFLKIVYSTKENNIAVQPNRNLICHGKQTNYNTKEMNLKLIMCMDIISELAWRVKNMKEEYSEMIIEQ